jgi:hypothetical protein
MIVKRRGYRGYGDDASDMAAIGMKIDPTTGRAVDGGVSVTVDIHDGPPGGEEWRATSAGNGQVKPARSSTDWGSLLGNVLGTAGSLFVRNFSPSQGLQTTNNLTPPRAPEPVKVVQAFPISTPVMVAGGLAVLGLGAFVLMRKPRGA